jgi:hypothetical protein
VLLSWAERTSGRYEHARARRARARLPRARAARKTIHQPSKDISARETIFAADMRRFEF